MAVAPSPLRKLADVARAARKFQLNTRFDLPLGKRLIARIGVRQVEGKPIVWMSLWEATGSRSVAVTDIDDAIRKVIAAYPKASLRPDSIEVTIEKGPMHASKLNPVAVQAWHEALGLSIPSLEELAEKQKAARTAKRAASNEVVELLKSGPAGIEEFNRRPLRERTRTDLRKADLAGCHLDGVDFGGADLEGADLSGASLVKAIFWGSPLPSRLKKARLIGADLTGGEITSCQGADADFSRAQLRSAWLAHGSYLRARFVGADLTGAELVGSDLRGADFTDAKLDDLRINSGKFDEHTRWPAGFLPPAGLTWKGAGPDPRLAPTKQEEALPQPTDFAGFLERLKLVTDQSKLSKALSMLKTDRFRLFAQVAPDHLVGVVKSQSDPSLVYSCRLGSDGTYACCTQNLNVCGGLRGSPCKHLLVLILGLTKAGEMDPGTAHQWTQASRGRKAALDKDAMAETFLRYKGAEAGEVDWRPTETIPEDFYAT